MNEEKRCSKCGEVKPLDKFAKDKRKRDGRTSACKDCFNAWYRGYWATNVAEELERNRAYREANREKERERHRIYRQTKPEKARESGRVYRASNVERERERHRIYREANREKARQTERARYAANSEKEHERNRRYRQTYREVERAKKARRKARERGAEGTFTANDITYLYENQNGLCFWCSVALNGMYHVDHIIPLIRGGSNWPSNLGLTCASCNLSKNDKLPYSEWDPLNPLTRREESGKL